VQENRGCLRKVEAFVSVCHHCVDVFQILRKTPNEVELFSFLPWHIIADVERLGQREKRDVVQGMYNIPPFARVFFVRFDTSMIVRKHVFDTVDNPVTLNFLPIINHISEQIVLRISRNILCKRERYIAKKATEDHRK
jgi:hypothetical protein